MMQMIVGRNSSVLRRDEREKNIYYYRRTHVNTGYFQANALLEWHPRRKRVATVRVWKTNLRRFERWLCDLSKRLLRVVEYKTTARWCAALEHVMCGACRLPMLEAIKTIVTLYDRIILTARAFIQAYRILTIGQQKTRPTSIVGSCES